jgi:general secretion pathway protein G
MNRFLPKHSVRDTLFGVFQQTGKRCFGIYNQKVQGLTLVEVMIVVVIIGILSSIAIPNYFSSKEKARMAATISEIKILEELIIGYNIDHGSYPETLDDIGMKTLKDLWGNPYQYLKIEGSEKKGVGKMRKDHNLVPVNSDFDLYSKGKDGKSQTPFTAKASRDDIVRANNGRYIGPVSGY